MTAELSSRIRMAVFEGKIDEIDAIVEELVLTTKLIRVNKDSYPTNSFARARVTVLWNPLAIRTLLGGTTLVDDITLPNVMHAIAEAMSLQNDASADVLRTKWGCSRINAKYFIDRIDDVLNDQIVEDVLGVKLLSQQRLSWSDKNDAVMNMFMDSLSNAFFYGTNLGAWVVFRLISSWKKKRSFAAAEFQFVRNELELLILNTDRLSIKAKRDVNLCLAVFTKMGYHAR